MYLNITLRTLFRLFGASHLVAVRVVQDESQTLVEAVGGHACGTAREMQLVASQTGGFTQEVLHEEPAIALAAAYGRHHDGFHASQCALGRVRDAERGARHNVSRLAENEEVGVGVCNQDTELGFSTGAARRKFMHQRIQVLKVSIRIFFQFGNHLN